MKKKNLNHKRLKLNKRAISSLESEEVKGAGTNISCFYDVNGNCAKTVTTCPAPVATEITCGCLPPPTDPCPSQNGGICTFTRSPNCN